MRWFPVAILPSGVFTVTFAGFELTTPLLDESAVLTKTQQLNFIDVIMLTLIHQSVTIFFIGLAFSPFLNYCHIILVEYCSVFLARVSVAATNEMSILYSTLPGFSSHGKETLLELLENLR